MPDPYTYTSLSTNFADVLIGETEWGDQRNSDISTIVSKLNEVGNQLEATHSHLTDIIGNLDDHLSLESGAHDGSAIDLSGNMSGLTVQSAIEALRSLTMWDVTRPDINNFSISHSHSPHGFFELTVTINTATSAGNIAQNFINLGGFIQVYFDTFDEQTGGDQLSHVRSRIYSFEESGDNLIGKAYFRYTLNEKWARYRLWFRSEVAQPGESSIEVYDSLLPANENGRFELSSFELDMDDYYDIQTLALKVVERFQLVQDYQKVTAKVDGIEQDIDMVTSTKVALKEGS